MSLRAIVVAGVQDDLVPGVEQSPGGGQAEAVGGSGDEDACHARTLPAADQDASSEKKTPMLRKTSAMPVADALGDVRGGPGLVPM